MLNQTIVVGRLKETKRINEYKGYIILSCPRAWKNPDGEYDTDYIKVILTNNILTNTLEYTQIGDLVCIKGHIERLDGEKTRIVADKVTFLASNHHDKEGE